MLRVNEESEKANLKLNIENKTKQDYGSQPHHFMANRRGKMEAVIDFLILGAKNHCRW